ncbi:Ecp52 [Fulvia fulva]|uniref:Ecp52 n=1 Tax=Passalora fulva TaxID=5499 RepID=A0A1P8YY40_PASFU|nr:Ecp52 [Fulvia fulva]AQA29275.1 extracellular protein 52 [Fulvia fulva]KAK4635031.1 Ecp52 [Fulvia fulva]KAK4638513.1 Ecp52 [Fulvia fulva]UJO10840.1 Ecp52 [Fulvia fulva]WPV08280.1 Ecp52 [Fulvia fulva]
MRSSITSLAVLATSLFSSSAVATLYFNATLSADNTISVHSWDDSNNNGGQNPEDIVCKGDNLQPTAQDPVTWTVDCTSLDNAKSDTVFDVFLNPDNKRFIDVIYRYSNPNAQGLNEVGGGENPDEFYFNFRVGSVDGKFFKSREFGAQQDILNLVKPESLKNPCDSLDTC